MCQLTISGQQGIAVIRDLDGLIENSLKLFFAVKSCVERKTIARRFMTTGFVFADLACQNPRVPVWLVLWHGGP